MTRRRRAGRYYCEWPGCSKDGTERCPGGERFCKKHYDLLGPPAPDDESDWDESDDRTEAEKRYDAERAHRPVKKNPDSGQLVQLVALVGAGAAGYFLLYKPWAQRRALEELTRNAILANQAKGMSIADAAAEAVAGACTAGAAVYKMPPALAGPICKGVGLVAVKGAQLAAKGAVIAGKVIGKGVGKGAKLVGKGVGGGAKLVGKGVGGGVKGIGKGAKKLWSMFGLEDLPPPPRRRRPTGAEYYTRHF